MTLHEATDLHWTRVSNDGDTAWHLIDETYVTVGGQFYMVKTRCGLDKNWDQTFADRLPGGSEKSCENCLLLLAGDVDTDSDPAPKKASKKK